MKILENKILKSSLFIFPLTTIIFFYLFIERSSELSQFKIKYERTNENHKKEKETLINQHNKLNNNINLNNRDIEELKKKGLSTPVSDLITDLRNHRELIPYKGILGGTMNFNEEKIWILNNKWIYAYFEDGHLGGYLLLGYNVDDSGNIYWERIAVKND